MGDRCVVCGRPGELNHLMPKSQRKLYREDPRNGLPLCGPSPAGHHGEFTAGRLLVCPEWLPFDTLQMLAEANWCSWAGMSLEPVGEGWRHFTKMSAGHAIRLLNEHGGAPMLARDLSAVGAGQRKGGIR